MGDKMTKKKISKMLEDALEKKLMFGFDVNLQLEAYKDTLVIDIAYNKVVRLVGFIEDIEDCYWKLQSDNGDINLSSCLIGWIPLKGYVENDDYDRLVGIWNMNQSDKAK